MVNALGAGTCVVCLRPYGVGDELGLLVDGWAHLECWDLALGDVDD